MNSSSAGCIVVVEDHPSLCDAIVNLLESVGHDARGFHSAEDFLESGVESDTRCLITDIQMPGMDGFQLVALLRRTRPDLPVIFMTARDEEDLMAKAEGIGFRKFYRKPLNDSELLNCVGDCLAE